MKPNKSTTILINVVLVLVIVFLLKSIIAFPKNLYAGKAPEYKCVDEIGYMTEGQFENVCNTKAKAGWKLHGFTDHRAIFER